MLREVHEYCPGKMYTTYVHTHTHTHTHTSDLGKLAAKLKEEVQCTEWALEGSFNPVFIKHLLWLLWAAG
jgi:hypothetical protein